MKYLNEACSFFLNEDEDLSYEEQFEDLTRVVERGEKEAPKLNIRKVFKSLSPKELCENIMELSILFEETCKCKKPCKI